MTIHSLLMFFQLFEWVSHKFSKCRKVRVKLSHVMTAGQEKIIDYESSDDEDDRVFMEEKMR